MSISHRRFWLCTFSSICIALALAVSLTFATRAFAASPIAAPGTANPSCQSVYVTNLALATGQPANSQVYGELCRPLHGPGHTVQVLVSGLTYNHIYWDWPNIPGHSNWSGMYSAVRYFTGYDTPAHIGYTTFAIDRIGTGQSTRPASTDVNLATSTYVLHEIVQRLKTGTSIGGTRFAKVIVIGHSFGSLTAQTEAATYHDVEGVVLTGSLHKQNSDITSIAKSIPAQDDPSLANVPAGYLTNAPGSIQTLFFYGAGTYSDPAVINYNEQIKDTMTVGELKDVASQTSSTLSRQINVPVLEVVGQDDILFCVNAIDCSNNATVYQEEAPFFSPQAKLQVQVIPNTGHDLNLHYSAPKMYAAIMLWSLAHVAP